MRIGPIGALYRNNEELCAKVVWESCLTTHGTIEAASMAFAVASAVRLFCNGCSADKIREILPSLVSEQEKFWLKHNENWKIKRDNYHTVSGTLRYFFTEVDLTDVTTIRQKISQNAKLYLPPKFTKAHPNQGYVLLGGIHALVMALLPDIQPQAVLRNIVILGYDVDTVGAIAGSVLGARFGCSWILKEKLMDRERIERYADAILANAPGSSLNCVSIESKEEFMQREAAFTKQEKEFKNAAKSQAGSQAVRHPKKKKERANRKNLAIEKEKEKVEISDIGHPKEDDEDEDNSEEDSTPASNKGSFKNSFDALSVDDN